MNSISIHEMQINWIVIAENANRKNGDQFIDSQNKINIVYIYHLFERGCMAQYFAHYHFWEDFKNGIFDSRVQEKYIKKAMYILSTPTIFKETIQHMFKEWHISCKVNLTNNDINKRAWVGAAACSYGMDCTEKETRIAWNRLNDKQRIKANSIAEEQITLYIFGIKNEQQNLFTDECA